jgi:RNA-directed DNA polymerase
MVEGRGRPAGTTLEAVKGQTQRWQPLLPNLQRVNAAALASGRTRFTALLHHVDVAALERAFRRQRRAASPGVDRVTMDQYEQDLAGNLQRLHARVHSGQYWPKPVLRTYIPKADGSKRPLGLPTLEDKIVQGAVAEVLNAIVCRLRRKSATAASRTRSKSRMASSASSGTHTSVSSPARSKRASC